MAGSSRERGLLILVIGAVVFFGGTYAYQNYGDSIWLQEDDITERQAAIETILEKQIESGAIIKRYEDMNADLVVEGEDSEQMLQIREQITGILKRANLEGKYRSFTPKDPVKEEDFKIIAFSIDDIECTPGQLGILLDMFEKQSSVMEVNRCDISNLVRETGEIGYGRRSDEDSPDSLLNGLLLVDLEISRLIEYRKGEQPKKRSAKRS